MIKFFRKIRQKLLAENKLNKYLLYAIGEIVLVVIGILIALQISNWNEERVQKQELDGLLQSIANGIKLDIRELNLLSVGRENIEIKADSVFNTYFKANKKSITFDETSFINETFTNILTTVSFNSNLSAFESLKNSIYFGKIQGTDLALLLNAYYTSANKIRDFEDRYNQYIDNLNQSWQANFRNNGENIFYWPHLFNDFTLVAPRYLEILKDDHTGNILASAYTEGNSLQLYRQQILMGTKLVEMIRNSKTTFDQQTKLDFSGILFSFADANLISILMNGQIPTGFDIRYAASNTPGAYISKVKDYLVIEYPENTYDWGSAYFLINSLSGRVNEMDFSNYSKMFIEMKGETGNETFEIAMKDIEDSPYGLESRVKIELTNDWKIYEIDTKQFITADMKTITVPLGLVFTGPIGRKIQIRSIQFKKD